VLALACCSFRMLALTCAKKEAIYTSPGQDRLHKPNDAHFLGLWKSRQISRRYLITITTSHLINSNKHAIDFLTLPKIRKSRRYYCLRRTMVPANQWMYFTIAEYDNLTLVEEITSKFTRLFFEMTAEKNLTALDIMTAIAADKRLNETIKNRVGQFQQRSVVGRAVSRSAGCFGCYVTCPNAVSSRVIHLVFHRLQHNCFSSLDSIKLVYQHPLERRSAATDTSAGLLAPHIVVYCQRSVYFLLWSAHQKLVAGPNKGLEASFGNIPFVVVTL
jgi:hypothetical protein